MSPPHRHLRSRAAHATVRRDIRGKPMQRAVVGVDVGTGSARAGIFTLDGRHLASAARPIRMWRDQPDHAEQSSADIWTAIRTALAEVLREAGSVEIIGIGFDATCSLVAADVRGDPVAVNAAGEAARDVIVWLDHRALTEADDVNRIAAEIGSEVTRYVGGRISLEMQVPKLLWLKRHLPESWTRAHRLFDLPDWLTWRATGSDSRSLCSTVCKWTYLGHQTEHGSGWDRAFFEAVGLGDLAEDGFARIGSDIRPMGAPVGAGLSARAAAELGLPAGIAVGTSAIDAHAGGIGTIGATIAGDTSTITQRLALICGTSSCHMAVSADPRFVPGVWGPYYSAMIPGLWLTEGGQSATGALLDHVIATSAIGATLGGPTAFARLNERLAELSHGSVPAMLTSRVHVLPDHHGNRSPRADATLLGAISGLSLSATIDDLAVQYLATVQALAYGTRHILEALAAENYDLRTIVACGGLTKNPVFLREHADATGCPIALPEEPDAVLLGAAVLGAVAAGAHADIPAAMAAMTRATIAVRPAGGTTRTYHDAKYAVFHRMHEDQLAYRALMDPAAAA